RVEDLALGPLGVPRHRLLPSSGPRVYRPGGPGARPARNPERFRRLASCAGILLSVSDCCRSVSECWCSASIKIPTVELEFCCHRTTVNSNVLVGSGDRS